MYFLDSNHEEQFSQLLSLKTDGGQKNERLSSLYVIAALPKFHLESFINHDAIDFSTITEYQLSSGEKKIYSLAFALYHGYNDGTVPLTDYLGYRFEQGELFIQALQLNYGLVDVGIVDFNN